MARISLLLGLLLLVVPDASGQVLDGAWFKLKVAAKGLSIESALDEPGDVGKGTIKTTVYLQLLADLDGGGGGVVYTGILWSEVTPGNWVPGDLLDGEGGGGPSFNVSGNGEVLLEAVTITVFAPSDIAEPDGNLVGFSGIMTGVFKIKLDSEGALKKASFKSLGGITLGGSADGIDQFTGGFKIRGATIPETKLPFVPEV